MLTDLLKAIKVNKNTTIAGICGMIGAACMAAYALFDGNPETVVNWEETITIIALSGGLLAARDGHE